MGFFVIENKYKDGVRLLNRPVMPLVSMVQFLFMTGPFVTVAEVIAELPEPIETDRATYEKPRAMLSEYVDILTGYEQLKEGDYQAVEVVDENNTPVDAFTAATSHIQQQVLTRELEKINSVLCAPCGCTLCCVGPDQSMAQEFFEIPLTKNELEFFEVHRYASEESRRHSAYDDDELRLDGQPFYKIEDPGLFQWQKGWSLILPRGSRCPNLDKASGQCQVYRDRPQVCRRPQIFPYMLEAFERDGSEEGSYRIRQSLLAIVDCPYVRDLRDNIAEYAAASDLRLVLRENKA